MIIDTGSRFFAHVPGETCPRGPFRSRRQAEQALANAAAKAERAAAPRGKRTQSAPIEPRVVRAVAPSRRLKRRKRAADARHEAKVARRRAKLGRVKRADPVAKDAAAASSSPAKGGTGA